MVKKIILFIGLIVILSACARSPYQLQQTPLVASEIDAGSYPENYQEIVLDYLKETLFDPDSLKDFSIEAPTKELITSDIPFSVRKGQEVYKCFAKYNAKNRMGGYTGKSTHLYYLRRGKVVYSY